MPELYIITGSNGAGKSTTGFQYLPAHLREQIPIFDGDKLFVEKRKELWRTIKSHKECAKLAYEFVVETFDRLVGTALEEQKSFIYEGHFTNESTWDIPRLFIASGYRAHLIFPGLDGAELSEARVTYRSQAGGHYVDPQTVNDNYYGNLEKLLEHMGYLTRFESSIRPSPSILFWLSSMRVSLHWPFLQKTFPIGFEIFCRIWL